MVNAYHLVCQTVIFDCCHAGGFTRGDHIAMRPRFTHTPHAIPDYLDSELVVGSEFRSANGKILNGFMGKSIGSHVLLAACGSKEMAMESVGPEGLVRGVFTFALLNRLHEVSSFQITYSDLIMSLPPLIYQHPQCEGPYKHRLLFNGKVVVSDSRAFEFEKRSDGTFAIQAGNVHGVIVGTEFVVQTPSPEPLTCEAVAILKAVQVKALWSIVSQRPGDKEVYIANTGKALVSDWKNDNSVLKVVVSLEGDHQLAHALSPDQVIVPLPVKRQFVIVDDVSQADIVLRRDLSGDLNIENLDPLIRSDPPKVVRFERPKKLKRLPVILDAVAHFYYHLRRAGDEVLEQSVRLELYRLTESNGCRVPDQQVGNLVTNASGVGIEYDEDAEYSVAIVNTSSVGLYPYLFYFDPSNYTIDVRFSRYHCKM
jgi:hypothetical protein